MSPHGKADDTAVIDDTFTSTQLWRQFLRLWPNYPVLHVLDPSHGRDEYFPTGLDNNIFAGDLLVARFRKLLGHSDIRRDHHFVGIRPRPSAPWKDLFIEAQQVLRNTFGPDIDLNVDARRCFLPDIDNSISIATLLRRLIIGENSLRSSPVTGKHFCGLGPARTIKGDEVFLLTGGKTPFVLRRRDDADDTIPGPRYEIIGDCYLQGWMDGEGEGLTLDNWEDITLV